VAKLGGLLRII